MLKKLTEMFANTAMRFAASTNAALTVVQPACWGIFHEPEAPNE